MVIKNKKGSEWTVAKLVSFILLAVFVVLVVYGVSTGAFAPLKQKAVNLYDAVANYFSKPNITSSDVLVPGVGYGSFQITEQWCKIDLNKDLTGKPATLGSYSIDFLDGNKFKRWAQLFTVSQESASDLYFTFDDLRGYWGWSPDLVNWMAVSQTKVSGGSYDGKSPIPQNLVILNSLAGKDLEGGKKVLESSVKKSLVSGGNWINYEAYVFPDNQVEYPKIRDNLVALKNSLSSASIGKDLGCGSGVLLVYFAPTGGNTVSSLNVVCSVGGDSLTYTYSAGELFKTSTSVGSGYSGGYAVYPGMTDAQKAAARAAAIKASAPVTTTNKLSLSTMSDPEKKLLGEFANLVASKVDVDGGKWPIILQGGLSGPGIGFKEDDGKGTIKEYVIGSDGVIYQSISNWDGGNWKVLDNKFLNYGPTQLAIMSQYNLVKKFLVNKCI